LTGQPDRAFFVTFEGGEGSGKSTQARLLKETLEQEGRSVLLLREPGGTSLGEEVRRLLLHRETPLSPQAELLLFLAARAQLVDNVIRPALERGDTVISDRFSDSTLSYQGYGRGLNLAEIRTLDMSATGGLTPDLTVLLDVPVEVGRERNQANEDAFEQEDDAFHEVVRQGYLALAKEEPERWLVLDGRLPIDVLREQILGRFARLVSR
jgi:dTMP kinase